MAMQECKKIKTPTTQQQSIYLPGYEAQIIDDGEYHSKCKVEQSAVELSSSTGVNPSKICTIPSIQEETLNYRCNCTFQIVASKNSNGHDKNDILHYAMRQNRSAKLLGADYFPIATPRIQNVMKVLMNVLNEASKSHDGSFVNYADENTIAPSFNVLKRNLSSASFVSSWNQNRDCIVTFNYDQPIYQSPSDFEFIIKEATLVCQLCNISAIILRSKKKKVIVDRNGVLTSSSQQPFIGDTLYMAQPKNNSDQAINVSLQKETPKYGNLPNTDVELLTVHYEKPHDAFQHPNQNAMLHALRWMLNKLNYIGHDFHQRNKDNEKKSLNMLEMYCGCGAHTMPIAKSGIFDSIVTVELDNRLVKACHKNAELNGLVSKESDGERTCCHTNIHIYQGDAGQWSKKILKHNTTNKKDSLFNKEYHVLLVDPPRAGLDNQVCDLAKNGAFEHIIYISCGREALKGDIVALGDTFEVADCTIIDLFPRTDSVESLVHLKRR